MVLGASFTVTCLVDGGLAPHQVQIVTPKDGKIFVNNMHKVLRENTTYSIL